MDAKSVGGYRSRFFCQTSAVRRAEKGGNLSPGEKAGLGCKLASLQGLTSNYAYIQRRQKSLRLQLRNLGLPQAFDDPEIFRVSGAESSQATKDLEEFPPQVDGTSTFHARSAKDAEEFGGREVLWAVFKQAFPRSLSLRPLTDGSRITSFPHYFLLITRRILDAATGCPSIARRSSSAQ